MIEIADSARKHGVADSDIEHAIRRPVAEVTDQRAPHFAMIIGECLSGELLEIGVLDPDGDQYVIHAMRLRHNWRRYVRKDGGADAQDA